MITNPTDQAARAAAREKAETRAILVAMQSLIESGNDLIADLCFDDVKAAIDAYNAALHPGKFHLGDRVQKRSGSSWRGKVVGFYSTNNNPVGLCVESEYEPGSVQNYPEAAFEPTTKGAVNGEAEREAQGSGQGLIYWAVSRWEAEVANRPLQNIHRRTLDDTWRQVIRQFGGDPDVLVGASHDELVDLARSQPFGEEIEASSLDKQNV